MAPIDIIEKRFLLYFQACRLDGSPKSPRQGDAASVSLADLQTVALASSAWTCQSTEEKEA